MSAAPVHSHFVRMTIQHHGYLCLSSRKQGYVSFMAKGELNSAAVPGSDSASRNTDSVSGAWSHFNYNRQRGGEGRGGEGLLSAAVVSCNRERSACRVIRDGVDRQMENERGKKCAQDFSTFPLNSHTNLISLRSPVY